MIELAIALCVIVPAVLAWGITEAIKRAWLSRYKLRSPGTDTKAATERMWWAPLLVFLSIAIGASVGLVLGAVSWDACYGAGVGAAGGVLASSIVRLIGQRLGRLADMLPGMPRG